jgi:hypothetical protein
MTGRKFSSGLVGAFVFFCAALTGCPTEPGEIGGGFGFINVTVRQDETKYFSLTTGEEVDASQKGTPNWDIAFHRKIDLFRLVFTNGGDTAVTLGSSGDCRVEYTEKTDFDEVRQADGIVFPGYDTDTARYVKAMGDAHEVSLNVMSYVGYTGDGTSASPFEISMNYDQKQFYASPDMGVYTSTGRVYIITHADGVTKSKIQINYEYLGGGNPADVYLVRFEELD